MEGNKNRDMSGHQSVRGNSNFTNDSKGFKTDAGQKSLQTNNLPLGPFGSTSNSRQGSGPTSLPAMGFKNQNSNVYSFELKSDSPNTSGSGSSSMLELGMEPKMYNWNSNGNSRMDTSSGGSSRTSSGHGSSNQLDWSGTVEGVFREEIRQMAEGDRRNNSFWAS